MPSERPTHTSGRLITESQADFFEKTAEGAATETVECLGLTFDSDESRRAHFLKKLRERLADPEFRRIPGFPEASDDDIIRLSDPPYYTACPNPFLRDFIENYGHPYDPNDQYRRSPFASDVSEGKSDPVYAAHSYHTKVPPRAILKYIEHYTKPGDLILDSFCGTGMTGVAAELAGATLAGTSMRRARVDSGRAPRFAVLCDLSPLATFISHNLVTPLEVKKVERLFSSLLAKAEERYGRFFATNDSKGVRSRVNYAVWSDVFLCGECASEVNYWEAAVDLELGRQNDLFPCPSCGSSLRKRSLERAFSTRLDPITGEVWRAPKRAIVQLSIESPAGRSIKAPDESDRALAAELVDQAPEYWCPSQPLPQADRFFKDGLHLVGLEYYHRFYFPRTLHVLAFLWAEIERLPEAVVVRNRLRFILTAMLDRNLTIRNRFVINKHNPQGRINGPLANTLYVPGLSVEQNPIEALRYKSEDIFKAALSLPLTCAISTQDASSLPEIENSFDYIFVDPPFGQNIMYSELNGLTESWLRVRATSAPEAIVSGAQKKSIDDYTNLMSACFCRLFHVLKPGRWMTVEFHNSQNAIWNSIQESLLRAGFVIADVRMLDKKKGTINQEFYSAGAVKTDLVISAYKPSENLMHDWKLSAGSRDVVWSFVREHLGNAPACVVRDGLIEPVVERQGHMLFNRMVAFHVRDGVAVPISAGEFYEELAEKFAERDGMYFLEDQVGGYDRARSQATEVAQLDLFVNDEPSAIEWVRQQLMRKPQTFQDLQPVFVREIKAWAAHEASIELHEVLEESFLCYDGDGPVPAPIHSYLSKNYRDVRKLDKNDSLLIERAKGRWYVPDPAKQGDLEKLRTRRLLSEFADYKNSRDRKLTKFRTDAIRAGFGAAWNANDYETIVSVAEKIPDSVIDEDFALLMYRDGARTRIDRE